MKFTFFNFIFLKKKKKKLKGIRNLSRVIGDHSPDSTKDNEIKNYFGRKVAIDASMCIYQFLIAVRQNDGMQLTNDNGEITR